ncbi:MAG: RNA-binding protein [Verrucomicrobiota bacterium]|nr:RNA-binding protein [Verrucomicrobiota bacterium]
MPSTLYVGNLPFRISDDDLIAHFNSAGQTIKTTHARDRASGRSNGCGFIEMEDLASANNAVKELNGSELEGRTITVALARPS